MSAQTSGNVSIAIDALGEHAYVTGNLGVAVFSIDRTTGSLSASGSLYAGPPGTSDELTAQIDPSGRFLVAVSSCGSGNSCSTVADWSIGANGSLTNPITLPNPLLPSLVAISPAGPFVYVDALDTSGNGVFEGWKLDTVSGALSPIDVRSAATFPGLGYSFTGPSAITGCCGFSLDRWSLVHSYPVQTGKSGYSKFLDTKPQSGVIYTQSELDAMNSRRGP